MAERSALSLPIETVRLRLREYRPADAPDEFAYRSDPEATRHLLLGPATALAESEAYIAEAAEFARDQPRSIWRLAIACRSDDRVLGGIELRLQRAGEADFGYGLRRDAWGNGYMTEATRALLDAAFARLPLHRIYATVAPDNRASWRVLEKLGMQREGLLRDHQFVRGVWQDSLLYAVLEDEWRGAAERAKGG